MIDTQEGYFHEIGKTEDRDFAISLAKRSSTCFVWDANGNMIYQSQNFTMGVPKKRKKIRRTFKLFFR